MLKLYNKQAKVIYQTKRGQPIHQWSDKQVDLPLYLKEPFIRNGNMALLEGRFRYFDAGHIENTNFYQSCLDGTTWSECYIDRTNFSRVDLNNAYIYKGNLHNLDFALCSMRAVHFAECELLSLDFTLADLRGAEFEFKEEEQIKDFIQTSCFNHACLMGCTINDKPILEWINKYNQD